MYNPGEVQMREFTVAVIECCSQCHYLNPLGIYGQSCRISDPKLKVPTFDLPKWCPLGTWERICPYCKHRHKKELISYGSYTHKGRILPKFQCTECGGVTAFPLYKKKRRRKVL